MALYMLCVFFALIAAFFADESKEVCTADDLATTEGIITEDTTEAAVTTDATVSTNTTGDTVSREGIFQDTEKLVLALNHFAFGVFKQLAGKEGENVFLSPLSLSSLFGMLHYGSRGQTEQELWSMLGYDKENLTGIEIHPTFKDLLEEIQPNPPDYKLDIANALLIDKKLGLLTEYQTKAQEFYGGSVQEVNFSKEGSEIVEEINHWAKNKTSGKIRRIVRDFQPDTQIALVSAAYFEGKWLNKFKLNSTDKQIFYDKGYFRKAKEVPMMHMTGNFMYWSGKSYSALEVPFEGDNVTMIILVPKAIDGLAKLERKMTPEKLSRLIDIMYGADLNIQIPKFKLLYSKDLISLLGVENIFQPDADFSGMINNGSATINRVLHKTFLEISEKGAEADAATQVPIFKISFIEEPSFPLFKVDRPFMFVIQDYNNDMIMYMGRIDTL